MIKALKNKYHSIKALVLMIVMTIIFTCFIDDPTDALLLMYLELFAMMAICGFGFWMARSFREAIMKLLSFLIIAPIILMIVYFGVMMLGMMNEMTDGELESNMFLKIMSYFTEQETIIDGVEALMGYLGNDLWFVLVGFGMFHLISTLIDQKRHKEEGKPSEDFDWWTGLLFQFAIFATLIAVVGSIVIAPLGILFLATQDAGLVLLIFLIVLRVSLVYFMGMIKLSGDSKGKIEKHEDVLISNEFDEVLDDSARKKQAKNQTGE